MKKKKLSPPPSLCSALAVFGWHDRPEQRISDVLRLDEAIAGLQLGLDHALPFPRNPPPKK